MHRGAQVARPVQLHVPTAAAQAVAAFSPLVVLVLGSVRAWALREGSRRRRGEGRRARVAVPAG